MGFLSGLFDTGVGEANKMNKAQLEWMKNLFGGVNSQDQNSLFGRLNTDFAAGLPSMQKAVGSVGQGFDQGIAAMSKYGMGAQKQIMAQQAQQLGNVRGAAAGSGMYGSSAMPNRMRGIFADTNRAMSGVADQQGRAMSGLMAGKGVAVGGALQNLANFHMQRAGMSSSLGQGLADQVSKYQYQPGQSMFSQLAPVIGYGLGGWAAGGFKGFGGKVDPWVKNAKHGVSGMPETWNWNP